jgi:hypothetical protein
VSFGANYGLGSPCGGGARRVREARGLWQIFSGTAELDAGGSWGRQATSRQKRRGEEMSGWVAGTLAALCFAAAIVVIVVLVWWL